MANFKVNFSQITTETPILENIAAEYQEIKKQFNRAQSLNQRQTVIQQWDNLRRQISTWGELTQLKFYQNTQNEAFKNALEYYNQLTPALTELEINFKRYLIESPHRLELEQSLGQHIFSLWESDITTFEPAIAADLVKESRLTAEYTELLASAELNFRGETVNLSSILRYTQDGDRDIRHQAEQVRASFFEQHQEQLDCLFDDLVKLRHRMAQKLGYENYISLAYRQLRRIGYNQSDIERFRKQIVREVVPLAKVLIEQQAKRLNLDKIYFWDEAVFDKRGSPVPLGNHDWMLARAQEMFDTMNQPLGDFFRMMVECDLLDLQTRPGKGAGGFCTSFPSYGVPYIFANFNGTKDDVQVFTHEMGHAFQAWQSRHLPIIDYLWSTSDAAEIHSMSLEFLTYSQMERFFGEQANRFRLSHLIWTVLSLPYGAMVDHFQHLIYAQPEISPQQRHKIWQELEAEYIPWRRYGDLNQLNQGRLWQEQQHIYCMPFYFIDYALAACCALQFWVKAEQDYQSTLFDYINLCKLGGTMPFQELLQSVKLISPFEPGALTQVVSTVSL